MCGQSDKFRLIDAVATVIIELPENLAEEAASAA